MRQPRTCKESIDMLQGGTGDASPKIGERCVNCGMYQGHSPGCHYAALAAKDAEIERLRKRCEEAEALVANMHEAAVGEICGPKVGVVEDVANLRIERDRLREEVATKDCVYAEGCLIHDETEARLDALTTALEKYGVHDSGCDKRFVCDERACTCGLDAALAKEEKDAAG